jgi:HD-like signal output (HDOD) protein
VHDTGKLFLARYFPQEYRLVMQRVQENEIPLLEAEKEVLAVTHPVAGAWLLDEWNLPVWLTEATKYHHLPEHTDEYIKITRSVGFADHLVRVPRSKQDPYYVSLEPTAEYLRPLKPHLQDDDEPDLNFYLENMQQELQRSEGFMSTIQKSGSNGD